MKTEEQKRTGKSGMIQKLAKMEGGFKKLRRNDLVEYMLEE